MAVQVVPRPVTTARRLPGAAGPVARPAACAPSAPARAPARAGADPLGGVLARAVRERAEAPVLARWLKAPANRPAASENAPKPKTWTENRAPPVGVAFVNRGTTKSKKWFRWDADVRKWLACQSPNDEAIRLRALATSTTTPLVDTPDVVLPEATKPEPDTTGTDTPASDTMSTDSTPPESKPTDTATTDSKPTEGEVVKAEVIEAEVQKLVEEELEPEPPPKDIADLPMLTLVNVLAPLSLPELKTMQLVSKRFERAAVFLLRARMQQAIKKTVLSSLGGTLCDDLTRHIARMKPDELFVLSDQVSPKTIEQLTGNYEESWYDKSQRQRVWGYRRGTRTLVYTGEHWENFPGTRRPDYSKPQVPVGSRHGALSYVEQLHGPDPGREKSKMHVKSMIGSVKGRPTFLETGSANFTASAMRFNTESAVIFEAPGLAKMFKQYSERVLRHEDESDDTEFSSALTHFNTRNPIGIRAALAPFVNVGEQLTAELQGADKVHVRMFLVTEASTGETNQPVHALCKLARAGIDVTVVVDAGQAKLDYVWPALVKLKKAGVNVFTETGPGGGGIMHDKLVWAHFPAKKSSDPMTELPTPPRFTVMIGSSGLTENVIENANYENLLIIDDKALFLELWKHDVAAAKNRTAY